MMDHVIVRLPQAAKPGDVIEVLADRIHVQRYLKRCEVTLRGMAMLGGSTHSDALDRAYMELERMVAAL